MISANIRTRVSDRVKKLTATATCGLRLLRDLQRDASGAIIELSKNSTKDELPGANIHSENNGRSGRLRLSIRCIYCHDYDFPIIPELDTGVRKPTEIEIQVLPYARDVTIFDSTKWTTVGGDFYTKVGYDKYFGILKIRSEVVSYCVAKCPSCKKLMDVYVNLSKDQKTLAMIWPQLFAKATDTITDSAPHQQDSADFTVGSDSERGKTVGRLSICEKTAIPAEQYAIALYKPRDILSQLSTWKTGLVAVLFSIFVLSIVPLWYQQPHGVTLGRFLRLHLSVILVRGTMLVALFFLLLLRQKYIQLFREMDEFRNLFNLSDTRGLKYWSNFAVSRFTGYQKEGGKSSAKGGWLHRLVRFNINGVVLLGGLSSSLILCFVWGLAQSGLIAGDSLQGVPKYVDLGFWLVVAYAAGIVVWNISIIPHYILKGIDIIIGGNLDAFEDGFKNVKIVDRVSTFAALGIAIMLMANQALLIYPIFITPFKEPRWVVLWAQFALILCYCMIVIRFLGKEGHRDLDKIPAILALGIIAIYCGARYAIGNPDNDGIIVEELRSLFNIHEAFPFRESAEAVFFGMVSSYFWFKLIQLLYPKFLKERKKAAKDKALAELREDYKKIKEDETLSSAERDTAIGANIAIRTYIESISLGSSFTQRILKLLSFVPVLTSVVSLLVTYLNFVHHY